MIFKVVLIRKRHYGGVRYSYLVLALHNFMISILGIYVNIENCFLHGSSERCVVNVLIGMQSNIFLKVKVMY